MTCLREIEKSRGSRGVDYITVHCGVTARVDLAPGGQPSRGRIVTEVVRSTRTGSGITAPRTRSTSISTGCLEICLKYDMTLSLGDGLRPGAIEDATDRPQLQS